MYADSAWSRCHDASGLLRGARQLKYTRENGKNLHSLIKLELIQSLNFSNCIHSSSYHRKCPVRIARYWVVLRFDSVMSQITTPCTSTLYTGASPRLSRVTRPKALTRLTRQNCCRGESYGAPGDPLWKLSFSTDTFYGTCVGSVLYSLQL